MPRASSNRSTADRAGLTREAVVEMALHFIDERGVDALTMRALAERLDVYPTALYWHAGSKAALIAAVCERVASEHDLSGLEKLSWQDKLRHLIRTTRANIGKHPNLNATFAVQMQVTPASFPVAEAMLSALKEAGLQGPLLRDGYNFVIGALIGFVRAEYSSEPPGAEEGWQLEYQRQLDGVRSDEFPVIAETMPWLRGQAFQFRWISAVHHRLDESFSFTMDVAIAGLEAIASRQRS